MPWYPALAVPANLARHGLHRSLPGGRRRLIRTGRAAQVDYLKILLGFTKSRLTGMHMTPKARRILQAILYEAIAVGFVGPGLAVALDRPATTAIPLAVFMSSFALAWSYIFNTLFERWEARQVRKGRSLLRRVAHASGFEGVLVITLVPVMAWWLDTSLIAAFIADLGVLAFFFIYAFIFTWAFDRVFGLPTSAIDECEA